MARRKFIIIKRQTDKEMRVKAQKGKMEGFRSGILSRGGALWPSWSAFSIGLCLGLLPVEETKDFSDECPWLFISMVEGRL